MPPKMRRSCDLWRAAMIPTIVMNVKHRKSHQSDSELLHLGDLWFGILGDRMTVRVVAVVCRKRRPDTERPI